MGEPAFNEHDTLPPEIDPAVPDHIEEAPTDWLGILKRLGPGLIIAGSIVGSGELIATTKTGAQAGISLLWLIIIGCLIKVFVQIELGRYTISHGETTLSALDQIPGPRLRVKWIIWYWLLMMLVGIGQLGGIVGGVGQSMALSFPIRGDYAEAILVPDSTELGRYVAWEADRDAGGARLAGLPEEQQERVRRFQALMERRLDVLGSRGDEILARTRAGEEMHDPTTYDDKIWAAFVAVFTSALLFRGRYRLIQTIATALVVGFTFITIGNVVSLQSTEQWHISGEQFLYGLSFQLPSSAGGINPLTTALATFGIIGVGATELVAYPYWCLEKGYAKFAGPRSDEAAWAARARGWIRVMRWDAFASMIVYTIATLAFFVMGVAVLYSEGSDPDGMRMVSTLASAYVPVFGEYARWLFLLGAIAVLYSTFMVANAGHARMFTDVLKVFGLIDRHDAQVHDRSIAVFSLGLPLLCLSVFCSGANPVAMILTSGLMQAIMLPMLGGSALYFRWKKTDARLRPGPLWDVLLAVSSLGLLIAGAWGFYSKVADNLP